MGRRGSEMASAVTPRLQHLLGPGFETPSSQECLAMGGVPFALPLHRNRRHPRRPPRSELSQTSDLPSLTPRTEPPSTNHPENRTVSYRIFCPYPPPQVEPNPEAAQTAVPSRARPAPTRATPQSPGLWHRALLSFPIPRRRWLLSPVPSAKKAKFPGLGQSQAGRQAPLILSFLCLGAEASRAGSSGDLGGISMGPSQSLPLPSQMAGCLC